MKEIKKNEIVKNTVVITLITVIAGVLLGLVYEITKEPIAVQNELAKQEACKAVFEEADIFEPVLIEDEEKLQDTITQAGYGAQSVDEIMMAKDDSDNFLGYVLTITSSEGYGGDIQFTLGIQGDGTINGISFLSISETAGLGMNAEKDAFKGQYAGKNVDAFEVTKNGASKDDQIDAISGATITSTAVTKGVNAGIVVVKCLEGGTN